MRGFTVAINDVTNLWREIWQGFTVAVNILKKWLIDNYNFTY